MSKQSGMIFLEVLICLVIFLLIAALLAGYLFGILNVIDKPACTPAHPTTVRLVCESPRLDVRVYRPQRPLNRLGLWCTGPDSTIDVYGNTSCIVIDEQRPLKGGS